MKQTQRQGLTLDDFVEGFQKLGLSSPDIVLVQSSFAVFRNTLGGPKTIIEALLKVLGPGGTLVMPTFNWDDFGEKKIYSKRSTRPQTGILCEMLMSWEGCRRIYHPIHGFSLVGARAEALTRKVKNESSFESSSLFGELHRFNAKILLLGVTYSQGFSFFHYIEEQVGVPYRKFLTLSGAVEEQDGTVREMSMKYYGRLNMNIRYSLDKVQPVLEESQPPLVRIGKIGMGTLKVMNAGDVYDKLAAVLTQNPNLVLELTLS